VNAIAILPLSAQCAKVFFEASQQISQNRGFPDFPENFGNPGNSSDPRKIFGG
jgi:hypothetical protein